MLKQKSNSNSSNLEKSEQINAKQLKQLLNSEKSLPKLVSSTGDAVTLSKPVNDLLYQVLEAMESGIKVTVLPIDKDMTIADAAEFLNVSPSYITKLLEKGTIPFENVGSSKHISTKDIFDYKSKRNAARRKGINELTAFMQEEGFYAD
ncbi:MAG: helix-turn-helix domain-containing protein [Pleurocapsa sp.]